MQNIDFSSQLRRNQGSFPQHQNNQATTEISENTKSRNFLFNNRWIALSFAAILIVFSLGLYVGLRIGTVQKIEKTDCIVRYPDENKSGINTNTTPAIQNHESSQNEQKQTTLSNKGNDSDLTYIIKVGSFNSEGAQKLTSQLNNVSEIRNLKPQACKGVQEIEPQRGVAFRMKDSNSQAKENVLIGCFQTAASANHVLDIVRKSGLPGSSKAELYEY